MGERNRLRHYEVDRGGNSRRNDHLDNTRTHLGPGLLRDNERTTAQAERFTTLKMDWVPIQCRQDS